ncbi:MAG: hypothetical protein GY820_17860, partial [Gammaproteobacteria bacterium]|nr:hypothetical protein [Gammaproteobacteria bacterium]
GHDQVLGGLGAGVGPAGLGTGGSADGGAAPPQVLRQQPWWRRGGDRRHHRSHAARLAAGVQDHPGHVRRFPHGHLGELGRDRRRHPAWAHGLPANLHGQHPHGPLRERAGGAPSGVCGPVAHGAPPLPSPELRGVEPRISGGPGVLAWLAAA